jgi:hypothetical protein
MQQRVTSVKARAYHERSWQSRKNRRELLAPYPCKFFHGWHTGHDPIAGLRDWEPKCPRCRHTAIVHDTHRGLGCMTCDCLAAREWVYRHAIMDVSNRLQGSYRVRRRLKKLMRVTFAALPGAVVTVIRSRLDPMQRKRAA